MYLIGKKAFIDNLSKITKVEISKSNKSLINTLKENNIQFEIKDENYFNKKFPNINHQFIISYIEKEILSLEDLISLTNKNDKVTIIMLDEINDPFNFGNIIRSAEAFGVIAIIYKGNNQVQINDTVIKASTGAISNIHMIKVNNLSNALEILKTNGFWIYATTLANDSVDYTKIDYENKSIIIFGNENKGISPLIASKSDFRIKIPMHGSVQSLNVGTSVGIVLA
jgi:23S rRNA (guanosine2251-2'-O)-methyltransferase